MKANVWGVKYNKAKGPKVWRLVVPSNFEADPRSFSMFLDKQSGEDSGLYVRSKSMWSKFIQHQEDKMRSGDRVRFTLAECVGLQDQVMTWGPDRAEERYIFDHHSMFDYTGKRLSPVDCVFFQPLSARRDAPPLLKGIR